jgi:hypothetical protein
MINREASAMTSPLEQSTARKDESMATIANGGRWGNRWPAMAREAAGGRGGKESLRLSVDQVCQIVIATSVLHIKLIHFLNMYAAEDVPGGCILG